MNKLLLTGIGVAAVAVAGLGIYSTVIKPKTQTALIQSKSAEMPELGGREAAPREIRWLTSMPDAIKESQGTGKPIFVDFYADWCQPCKMLDSETYVDSKVIAESQKWVMVKIDTDKQTDLAVKYQISGLPTLAVLDSRGKPVSGMMGFVDGPDFVDFLRKMKTEVAAKKS